MTVNLSKARYEFQYESQLIAKCISKGKKELYVTKKCYNHNHFEYAYSMIFKNLMVNGNQNLKQYFGVWISRCFI